MSRFKIVNNQRIQFTPEEEVARDVEEKEWADGAFDRALLNLREKRNQLLAETDWWATLDRADLITMDQKIYRQELRDLPTGLDTVDKVNAVTWPTKPE